MHTEPISRDWTVLHARPRKGKVYPRISEASVPSMLLEMGLGFYLTSSVRCRETGERLYTAYHLTGAPTKEQLGFIMDMIPMASVRVHTPAYAPELAGPVLLVPKPAFYRRLERRACEIAAGARGAQRTDKRPT